ncbi:MAG: helix-turn-helix domain-containing protein [Halobacteriota archaeon]
MKYLNARFRLPDRMHHPMHAFARDEDAVDRVELLAWNRHRDRNVESELFYVRADPERYRAALDRVESIQTYAMTSIDERSFHLFVCEEPTAGVTRWREAFFELDLVVVPPIRFDEEGVVGLTLVGNADDIQRLLGDVPVSIDVSIDEIGTYDHRDNTPAGVLTDRQREAIEVALEWGYYDVPRSAPLSAVADALDVAESSASLLLRRAERRVFTELIAGRGTDR